MATLDEARAAKVLVLEQLVDASDVAGVGITKEGLGYGLKINVNRRTKKLPSSVNGVPVHVEYVGPIRALRT